MYALKQVIICYSMVSDAFVLGNTIIAPLGHQSLKYTLCVFSTIYASAGDYNSGKRRCKEECCEVWSRRQLHPGLS